MSLLHVQFNQALEREFWVEPSSYCFPDSSKETETVLKRGTRVAFCSQSGRAFSASLPDAQNVSVVMQCDRAAFYSWQRVEGLLQKEPERSSS